MTAQWVLIAMGTLVLGAAAVGAVLRWPIVGMAAVGLRLVVAWELPDPIPLAGVGGAVVSVEDVIVAVLLLCALASVPHLMATRRLDGTVLILGASAAVLFAVSFARGVSAYGLNVAGNEFRASLYLLVVTVWFASLDQDGPHIRRATARVGTALFVALVAVAALHIALYGLGSSDSLIVSDDGEQTGRALVASQAFLVGVAACWGLSRWSSESSRWGLAAALVAALTVVVTQQRTVWAAVLGGLLVLIVLARGRQRRRLAVVGAATAVGAVVAALVATLTGRTTLGASLAESLSSSGTYNDRVQTWAQLFDRNVSEGFSVIMFGNPFGTGYARIDGNNQFVTYVPHNWALVVFLRTGVVGVASLLALFAVVAVLLLRRGHVLELTLLAMVLVYSYAYVLNLYLAPFLGVAVAAAMRRPGPVVTAPVPAARSTAHRGPGANRVRQPVPAARRAPARRRTAVAR